MPIVQCLPHEALALGKEPFGRLQPNVRWTIYSVICHFINALLARAGSEMAWVQVQGIFLIELMNQRQLEKWRFR